MPVDLSGPLRSEVEKAREAYEKARGEGNPQRAWEQAARCARLLRLLGDNIPHERRLYLEKAKKWEDLANSIKEKGLERREPEGDVKPSALEFSDYIEGLISTSEVTWADIGGLEEPKELLQETVVIAAMKKPEAIKPWTGILLYGPPGTGKTLLAAAAAGSLKATFFNVSADKVLSKYYGESSRLIATLYEVAQEMSPAIVFIDEMDALTLSRSGDLHEASRRTLSTLLSQIDGFKSKKSQRLVLTLAATNAPWDIDPAALSRFSRRIHIPLPDTRAAVEIIKLNTSGLDTSEVDFNSIAQHCQAELFSGRDISYLCQEAVLYMIRQENPDLAHFSSLSFAELRDKSLKTRALKDSDFHAAREKIKPPLTQEALARYSQWTG
jgi:SpoVK/Ycf46/Vps4 family AAA+-type ATPase